MARRHRAAALRSDRVTERGTIAISLDLGWAPEEVLEDTLERLASHRAATLVFATLDSRLVER